MSIELGPPGGSKEEEESWSQDKPLWLNKILAWRMLVFKNCPVKAGPGGIYCQWTGHNCFYDGCPRRIFEEAMVTASALPPPPPSANFKQRVLEMQGQIEKLEGQITALQEQLKKQGIAPLQE